MHRQVAAVGQNSGAAVFRFSLRANRSSTCRPSLTVENFLGSPKASQLNVGTPGEKKIRSNGLPVGCSEFFHYGLTLVLVFRGEK